MSAPDSIYQLVEKFDRDKPGSETEVRIQFVDPLFSALGWDMRDKRQVRHEPRVTIPEAGFERSKQPDYSFHIGNATHFFVETKMPHVNLERNPIPAFQLRRYGWSGATLVSVLTDFEEFSVYDCRIQPQRGDPANKARLRYYQYSHYIDKWDELESRFSYDAVAQGALREWIEGERIRGVFSVDQAFLREMEKWREMLAEEIALHNRDLGQRQLNLLVQRSIDRIVFLRIAEDRDIEAYGRLRSAAGDGKQVYQELKILFNEADDKYNSGLFHFGNETRASQPDRLSLNIHIPDEPLRHIIKNLYFPDSPYEFSVLPADILGQVYEQFLGKVIELSAGGGVRVQEKPEVRKAGGVYYTPAYIVDYIVENTVGDLLWGKTPDEAAQLRILDPACGSGSFLTGAYQYLLDWHLNYYREHPKQYRNRRRETADGFILTTAEKRRILQNNIYGVDLDQNAVEVSKLSLLLKMLEKENDATGRQTIMFSAGGRILPDLSGNIKWGNSLIGSDFFRGSQAALFDNEEEMNRVKAFDWDSADGFGDIMAAGGFDAVIGNPPYVILGTDVIPQEQIEYLRQYEVAQYKTDLYHLFFERGIRILKTDGILSLITPNPWLTQKFTNQLREYIVKNTRIVELVVFDHLVFKDANVYTAITSLQKQTDNRTHQIRVKNPENATTLEALLEAPTNFVGQNNWRQSANYIFETRLVGKTGALILRILSDNPSLGDVARASLGCQAYNRTKHTQEQIKNRVFHSDKKQSEEYLPELAGRDVGRYVIERKRGTWIKYGPWLHDYRTMDWLEGARILIREIPGKPPYKIQACYLEKIYCNYKTILNVNPSEFTRFDMKYLTGLLNSKLLSFVYPFMSNKLVSRSFPRLSVGDLRKLPIRTIDFDNPADVAMHDKMVELVDEMLDRHKQLPSLKGEGRKIAERLIKTVDEEIDALVYRLYGLSDDEVRIVEGG
ncbi:MAG: N-6 DNA methylase [Chloroflexi bacterium]|nr:N-6 DNA methylase [Chloroflexota bacterium]